jgi:hypothetical protein
LVHISPTQAGVARFFVIVPVVVVVVVFAIVIFGIECRQPPRIVLQSKHHGVPGAFNVENLTGYVERIWPQISIHRFGCS